MVKLLQIFTAFFLLLLISSRGFLWAQNSLTVTIRVGLVNLTFSGKTSPNSQVTVLKDGTVAGTTVADDSGDFSKTLTGLEEGVYSIGLYGVDLNNETTSTVQYSVALVAGTDTTLANIILPSTIVLDDSQVIIGDDLKIHGYGVPGSTITVFVTHADGSLTKTTVIDGNGYWEYLLETKELAQGSGSLYVKVSTTEGYQSEASKILSFEIGAAPTAAPAASTSQTSQDSTTTFLTPTVVPSPTPFFLARIPKFLNFFDIDGSGRIELREVFGSVKIWVESWRNPQDLNCDLNNDGLCNLIDFSILMFYIGK